ncbi:F-box protein At5g25290 [Capsella rubella]|uniref:F-box protein At5g25290 n=1 Tax=Capsella rubella TaxID=81985 RepID=UPI000CD56DEF|nr:F-box protein At5g25290 [Capsella rubella]
MWSQASEQMQLPDLYSKLFWNCIFNDTTDCLLYNPHEKDIIYIRAAPSRLLASCGKWLLMIDSQSRLYVIDVFSGNKIDLPPLESLKSNDSFLKRMEDKDKEFEWEFSEGYVYLLHTDEIRARLWIDEKAEEIALVWFFDSPACFLGFYKKGNAHYDLIPITYDIARILTGMLCLILRGYCLYILTMRRFVRVIDFSMKQGFEEVTGIDPDPYSPIFPPLRYHCHFSIAVTTLGEVLFVTSTKNNEMAFRIYKMDPNAEPDDHMPDLLDVDSLGDEALLLDLGITVPANYTLGIKPNSIYFTHHNLIHSKKVWNKVDHVLPPYDVDICVFNLSTKTLEPFPAPSNMTLKDARLIFS